jgi:hypothetical protein
MIGINTTESSVGIMVSGYYAWYCRATGISYIDATGLLTPVALITPAPGYTFAACASDCQTGAAVVVLANATAAARILVCSYTLSTLPTASGILDPAAANCSGTAILAAAIVSSSILVAPRLSAGGALLSITTGTQITIIDVAKCHAGDANCTRQYTQSNTAISVDTLGHFVVPVTAGSASVTYLDGYSFGSSQLAANYDIYQSTSASTGGYIDPVANMYYSGLPVTGYIWRVGLDAFSYGLESTAMTIATNSAYRLVYTTFPNAMGFVAYTPGNTINLFCQRIANCVSGVQATCLSDYHYCAWVIHTGTCILKNSAVCTGNATGCNYGPLQVCPTLPATVQCLTWVRNQTGSCIATLAAAGTSCNDYNPLTHADVCSPLGICEGVPCNCPTLPPASVQCISESCDPVNHTCILTLAAPGSVCDDGNPLTHTDVCSGSGICAGTPYPNCRCPTLPAGVQCVSLVCNISNGACMANLSSVDTLCDDGDPLTNDDACTADGTCVGTPATCWCPPLPPPARCVTLGCNATTRACMATLALPGTACDDGNPLTINDTCGDGGACAGTAILNCDCPVLPDSVQCVTFACNSSGNCHGTFASLNTACDDHNPLTYGDSCGDADGICTGAAYSDCDCPTLPPGVQCVTLGCNLTSGVCIATLAATGSNCTDGNPLTYGDTCSEFGICSGHRVANCLCPILPPGAQCFHLDCDNATGACLMDLSPAGAACDDNDPLTVNDTCAANGVCSGIPMPNCGCPTLPPGVQCMTLGCVSPGICGIILDPAGSNCTDGDPLTFNDTCSATGVCDGHLAPNCACPSLPDGVQCVDIACNYTTEICSVRLAPLGQSCDDGHEFTIGDACTGTGICLGTLVGCGCPTLPPGVQCLILDCAPGNDTCRAHFAAVGTPCDDGIAYTHGDTCRSGGACRGTPVETGYPCETTADCSGLEDPGICRIWDCSGDGVCTVQFADVGTDCAARRKSGCEDGSGDLGPGSCDASGSCVLDPFSEFPSLGCGAGSVCALVDDWQCVAAAVVVT